MGVLRTDSPLSRRIVLAILDFLDSVEAAPGVSVEGLDVAKECLEEVFKLDSSSTDDEIQPGLLVNLFSSSGVGSGQNIKSDSGLETIGEKSCTTSGEDQTEDRHASGAISKDELFVKFYMALDRINYFSTAGAVEDPVLVANATCFFDDAYTEMEKSGNEVLDSSFLAETFKSKGNQSMQLKSYSEAIELYTCAIALCEKNAVYYCNRAAAYTQTQRYTDAVDDCLKSIQIDPTYSKGYSRLGFAYYAQGKYKEALNDGFLKALQLDPDNESVKENVSLALLKLTEQQVEANGNRGSSHGQESGRPFTSFPFNSSIPLDLANIFRNVAPEAQVHQAHERAANGNAGESNESEVRIDGNVSVHTDDHGMPEQLSDALRSVMGMFSSQQGRPGGT